MEEGRGRREEENGGSGMEEREMKRGIGKEGREEG